MEEKPDRPFWQVHASTLGVLIAGIAFPLIMMFLTVFDRADSIQVEEGVSLKGGFVTTFYIATVLAVASICELRSRRKERAKP